MGLLCASELDWLPVPRHVDAWFGGPADGGADPAAVAGCLIVSPKGPSMWRVRAEGAMQFAVIP